MHFTLGHTVTSVPSYLSAIQHYWTAADAGPLPKGPAFKLFHRGLKRVFGTSDEVVRTTAISVEDLSTICSKLDMRDPNQVSFGCEIITAFFLALRTEDHVDGKLRNGDIFPHKDGSVAIVLAPGKSTHVFRHVVVAKRTDGLDLLTWLKALAAFKPHWARAFDRPVFVTFAKTAGGAQRCVHVSRAQFTARFKVAVRDSLGMNPAMHSGYSLRRGGVTAMIMAGTPAAIIKRHVGWSPGSEAIFLYYDHSGHANKLRPTKDL
jgi:hypothetical protein